jgi:multiple sugar transport system substrate-binding protein
MPNPWAIPRRAFLGSLAAGAAAFAAFGPRGQRDRSDGRIVLDYWEKWTGHEGRAMQAIVDRFNQSQSRIFVRYLVTAGVDEKGMVAIAGGSPPDLLGLYAYNIPLFAESGAILPLDELAPSLPATRYAEGLRPFVVHPARDGTPKTWAVISSAGTLALYYNKSRLAEIGVTQPPATMEEFDDLNRRLTVMKGSDIDRAGFIHAEPGWWSWIWSQPFGGSIWDPKAESSTLTAPETIRGYDWVRATSTAFPRDAFARFRARFGNYDSPLNAFLTGHLAMIVQGPWLANVIETHHDVPARLAGRPPLDYGVIPLPAIAALRDDARPIGPAEADIVVIPRGVRHPEACVEFLAFCQQQAHLEELARAHFKNSPLTTSSAEFLGTHPNKGVAAFDAIANSPRSFVTPRTRVWPEIKREMDQMMDYLFRGEGSATEVLTRVSARVHDILARDKAKRLRRWPGSPNRVSSSGAQALQTGS